MFGQVAEDVKKLGGAAMLTEWGQGCDFNSGKMRGVGLCVSLWS